MTRNFVSRDDQLEYVRGEIISRTTGAIVITGEPGIGRTAFLAAAMHYTDPECDESVWLHPSHDTPFVTLRSSYLPSLPESVTARDVVETMVSRVAGRRLIVAVDDAHLMDYSSLFVLRRLARFGKALLLVTRPVVTSRLNMPDPTNCLAHDRDTRTITLLPLSVGEVASALTTVIGKRLSRAAAEAVHAATGGNPGNLHGFVSWTRGAGRGVSTPPDRTGHPDAERLVDVTWESWRRFAIERTDQLCHLALRCGLSEEIAPIWGMLLLLRGHADECITFLGSLTSKAQEAHPAVALVRAMTLALGLRQTREANDFLLASVGRGGRSAEFLLASRAWLLAITGQEALASDALASLERGDVETALFIHAANAALASLRGRPAETVFHLRRAVAVSETSSNSCPWMRPYLHASLIDALLIAGRVKDAVTVALRFHAREPESGWEIALSMGTLIGGWTYGYKKSFEDDRGSAFASLARADPHCICHGLYPARLAQQECARFHTRACGAVGAENSRP